MGAPTSSGSYGQANVGSSTVGTAMANWAIPEPFRDGAVNSVRLLVLAATEGTYSAQAFLFDVSSGASLTTLLVVAIRLSTPADPNSPVAVMYVTINTNAPIKQLYSYWNEEVCHRCPKCVWLGRCCCHDEQRSAARGHTTAELNVVRQKMTADQYVWFNQQNLSPNALKRFIDDQNSTLTEAIENFLSNNTVKAEILASYNDSVITAIQTNLTSLKLFSQTLKLTRVHRQNLPIILAALAEEHGFDNIYSNSNYSQQLESSRFSYENLFTSEISPGNDTVLIKYIWILGQLIDNSTYAFNFLSVNITSKTLIETMLLNSTTNFNSSHTINENKQLNIVRIASLTAGGEFFNERLLTSITSWQQKTTRIVLNMLRFIGATVLVPQQFRMLSYFDLELVSPEMSRADVNENKSTNVGDKLKALASSVSTVIGTVKEIIQTLNSSKSITIQRVTRFGFNYFNQKSTTLKAIDIPSSKANEFINALSMDYNLPSKGSFMLGLTYSDDFAWEQIQYLYSPDMNGHYRSLTLFKNGDSTTNTASFYIVDTNADWNLAPDLLIITKTKSLLGGFYTSSSQSIQEVPHMLSIDEAVQLQKFFMLVAIGNMAGTLGLNATIPQ
jgi:hypothetical protein